MSFYWNSIGTYRGVSGRGPSPNLWHDLPEDADNPNCGFGLFDDFLNQNTIVAGTGSTDKYASYGDTGVTLSQLAGVTGGVLEIAGNDADNDEGVLSTHGPLFQVSDTAGAERDLWYEVRLKKASIADNACALFAGLAFDHGSGVPVAVTLCLTDDDADLGAFSYLGFHVDQAAGETVDFVYKAEGQAQTVAIAGVHTLVADTYVKLGFRFKAKAATAKRIAAYVDNVEQSTYITGTNIAAATFPDAEPLGMVLASKVGAAAESKAQFDWHAGYQSAVES